MSFAGDVVKVFILFSPGIWEQTKSVERCGGWLIENLCSIGILEKIHLLTSTLCMI